MEAARENRLLIGKGGMYGNVMRISPPMNIGRSGCGPVRRAAGPQPGYLCGRPAAGSRHMSAAELPLARNLERFPELHPAFDPQPAIAEANRCLYCFDAPCTAACPTHIDVPRFIKKIASGNLRGLGPDHSGRQHSGAELLPRLPGGCAVRRRCVMHQLQPAADRHRPLAAPRHGCLSTPGRSVGRRLRSRGPERPAVACIGGGPASLACAAELRRHGYAVTIFDNRPLPGGLNTYGVAEYKLRPSDSLREVDLVRALGVEFRQAEVGATLSLDEIEEQFATHLHRGGAGRHGAPGHSGRGGRTAWWTRCASLSATRRCPISSGPTVVVIGGGNTAIDAANAAVRLGAEEVHLFYRRTENEMPAFSFEYDHSKIEGVQFHWLAQPVEMWSADGRAVAVKFIETQLGAPDATGRRRSEADPRYGIRRGMRHGDPGARPIAPAGASERIARHCRCTMAAVVVDRATGRTANPNYYAGGDCVNGGREVVDAVADGKRAARCWQMDGVAWLISRPTSRASAARIRSGSPPARRPTAANR